MNRPVSPLTKSLIGLVAVLLLGVLHHGPLGAGEAFVDGLDARARQRLAVVDLPGVTARFDRAPLSRAATLSGEANSFQREGLGSFPGLNERIATIPGASHVRWAGEPGPRAIPLVAETLFQLVLAYLAGLSIGRLWFGRKKRTSFLD